MADPIKQLKLRERPDGVPIMHQKWRDLFFAHYALDPGAVQSFLPDGLEVDVHPNADGEMKAWIGLVAFTMHGIRPPWLPPFPWISAFAETNLRTYVQNGDQPGIWFFSLDASRRLAVEFANAAYGLPYLHADIDCDVRGSYVSYDLRRLDEPHAEMNLKYEIGENRGAADPGTFEFWLVERYLLFVEHRGELFEGQVHHVPYQLFDAHPSRLQESISSAQGLTPSPYEHFCYCPGVDAEFWPLRRVLAPESTALIPSMAQ